MLTGNLPAWLKKPSSPGRAVQKMRTLLREHRLQTICENALCPNRGECYSNGTVTFLILGNLCTRACRFCNVSLGKPQPPDAGEPDRVAQAVQSLGLNYAVITSVTRDDLEDGGAGHFARVIRAVRQARPKAVVEVLTPDFQAREASLATVCEARPDIFNHNLEVVGRLYGKVRPQAIYERSLGVLRAVKSMAPNLLTKSGFMLGLGETQEEVWEVFRHLKAVNCDIVTVGQYLNPRPECLPVERYASPEEFESYGVLAKEMGLSYVFSGPFVRSSYHASQIFEAVQGKREDSRI